jgi:hypothetical protein
MLVLGALMAVAWYWSKVESFGAVQRALVPTPPLSAFRPHQVPSERPLLPVRLPPEIARKVSRWSLESSVTADKGLTQRAKGVAAEMTGNAAPSTSSPFPEPKKVLTPEELEAGSWR